jgi:hypothetical protein
MISARYVVGLYWVPGHAGVRCNEIDDEFARAGSALGYLGPELALGVSRRDMQITLSRWPINQHCASRRDLGNTQRQARELISIPSLCAKVKILSFNRTQTRVVTGLVTGHTTLRRHLYIIGLLDSPLFRKCKVKEEISAHIVYG